MSFAGRPTAEDSSRSGVGEPTVYNVTPAPAPGPKSQIIIHRSEIPHPRAFTFIELLVVIAIIVLLMAILLPTLGRVRRQAKAAACQSNLRQSGLYFAAYAAENDGKFALHSKDSKWFPESCYHLPVVAGPSLERKDLLLCPAAAKAKSVAEPVGGTWETLGCNWTQGDTLCPWTIICRDSEGGAHLLIGSYGFNVAAGNFANAGWGGTGLDAPTDVRQASNIPAYLDCMTMDLLPGNWRAEPPPYQGFVYSYTEYSSLSPSVINRHAGGVNCLFWDWSVRKVGLKELWTLKWMKPWDPAGPWTKRGGVQPEDWPAWMRKFKDY